MLKPIPVQEFITRTEICIRRDLEHPWARATQVVSPRELVKIHSVQLMSREYLAKLIYHTTIVGGNREHVYAGCKINLMRISPEAVRIGQRFIQRSKYIEILENFTSILEKFAVSKGILNLWGMILIGETADGALSIAHYVPPIVEMNGGSKWTLLDGLHRNFLINQMGGETPVVAIEGVKIPFPCNIHDWNEIKVVEQKPPREERYFDLKPELFRSLEFVGIDG